MSLQSVSRLKAVLALGHQPAILALNVKRIMEEKVNKNELTQVLQGWTNQNKLIISE